MARMIISGLDDYASKLSKYSDHFKETANKAVKAGANPVADEIRRGISSLPEENFRYLKNGEKFTGVPPTQKKDLLDSLGVTPPGVDRNGDTDAKIGFDGYGSHKTKKYKKGLPNALLARSIESGSTVRKKNPFIRKAVSKTKELAIQEISKVVDEDIKNHGI